MKKLLLVLMAMVCCFGMIGCSNNTNPKEEPKVVYVTPIWKGSLEAAPENPEAGWAYYNTKDKTTYIFDGKDWQIMAKDGNDGVQDGSLKFLGETKETVDGVEYTVKSYAQVIADIPYYYTYYKQYYLNGKLRRLVIWYHGISSDLDNAYTDFTGENFVIPEDDYRQWFLNDTRESVIKRELIFDENGKINSFIMWTSDYSLECKYTRYESGNMKKIEEISGYDDEDEKAIFYYYDVENQIFGDSDKRIGSGIKAVVRENYDSLKFGFKYYYESGYLKYYYSLSKSQSAGNTAYLYTYADGQTEYENTREGVYSSREEKTEAQMLEFIQTLGLD